MPRIARRVSCRLLMFAVAVAGRELPSRRRRRARRRSRFSRSGSSGSTSRAPSNRRAGPSSPTTDATSCSSPPARTRTAGARARARRPRCGSPASPAAAPTASPAGWRTIRRPRARARSRRFPTASGCSSARSTSPGQARTACSSARRASPTAPTRRSCRWTSRPPSRRRSRPAGRRARAETNTGGAYGGQALPGRRARRVLRHPDRQRRDDGRRNAEALRRPRTRSSIRG